MIQVFGGNKEHKKLIIKSVVQLLHLNQLNTNLKINVQVSGVSAFIERQ